MLCIFCAMFSLIFFFISMHIHFLFSISFYIVHRPNSPKQQHTGFDWMYTWYASLFNVLDHTCAYLFADICHCRKSSKSIYMQPTNDFVGIFLFCCYCSIKSFHFMLWFCLVYGIFENIQSNKTKSWLFTYCHNSTANEFQKDHLFFKFWETHRSQSTHFFISGKSLLNQCHDF